MKTLHKLLQYTLLSTFIFIGAEVLAQMPDCSKYYKHVGSSIVTVDPLTNAHTTNTISTPGNSNGLAINNNLNAAAPSPTFYTCVGSTYYYYNGSTWVNTGHSTGSASAVNPGGAGPYIYNLDGLNGRLYRYDGTGNSTLFLNIAGYGGPYDVIGDAEGNVYVFFNSGTNRRLAVYNPAAQNICNYTFVNLPAATSGGGYAVVDNKIFVNAGSGYYSGTISGTTITFTPITNTGGGAVGDYANCPFPPLNVTLTPSATTLDMCSLQTLTITGTTSVTNPIWSWTGPGIVSGGTTNMITVNQPGTYTAVVTSSGGACTGTATSSITITTSGASPPIITQPVPICINASPVQVNVSSTTGTWSSDCGACLSATGMFDPAVAGIGSHQVTYTTTGTCSGTDTKTIVVSALPAINAGPDQSICPGAYATLTASGGTSYTWNNGVTTAITSVSPTSQTTYTVVGTDANGCSNTDAVIVSLAPPPIVSGGIDRVICSGDSVMLSGSGAMTYTWNNGVVNDVYFQPATTMTYIVTGTASGCSATDTVLVTVSPSPQVVFTGVNLLGCAPLTSTFTPQITGNVQSVLWNFGDNTTSSQNAEVTHTFQNPGCYDVSLKVVSDQGCIRTTTYSSFVCVLSNPVARFDITDNELTSSNTSTQMINTSENGSTYVWQFGDGSNTSNLFAPLHTFPPNRPGSYVITLVAFSPDGCSDTTRRTIIVSEEMIFYVPNAFTPDGDNFNQTFFPVFTTGFDPYAYTLTMYDRWGEIMFISHDSAYGWDGTYNGNMCQDGTYSWTIKFKVYGKDEYRVYTGHVNLIR